eukprot:1159717-Pelagomonas_calceolata.AAC.7
MHSIAWHDVMEVRASAVSSLRIDPHILCMCTYHAEKHAEKHRGLQPQRAHASMLSAWHDAKWWSEHWLRAHYTAHPVRVNEQRKAAVSSRGTHLHGKAWCDGGQSVFCQLTPLHFLPEFYKGRKEKT